MRRTNTFVATLFTCALFACGCSDSGNTDRSLDDQQTTVIRRGNVEDPANLDPALAEDVHSFNVLIDLYEGLVAEAADGRLIPGVAQSWEISDDGLVYKFKLRPDARWSNGDPVVAMDFVHAFRRVASPDSLSPYGFLLEPVSGFDDVRSSRKPAHKLGVVADSDDTLVIRLSAPSSHLLSVLAMPIALPIHGDNPRQSQFSNPADFVGNGAYVLVDRQVGGLIRLRRNVHYWDKQAVAIDEIEYLPIIDAVSELNMYRTGELDITGSVPPSHFKALQDQLPTEIRVAPTLAFYYLAFDLTEAPFDNRLLRQALSMAIDREQLVALIGRGEQAAYGIVPPGVANHVGAKYIWHNSTPPDRERQARELYRAAGYDSESPRTLKLTYDIGDIHERVALVVSSMWTEVLGVAVELEKKEWKLFLDTRDDRPSWQIMRFSWFGDYNDASTFTDVFRSDSPQNLPGYDRPLYDEILDEAKYATSVEERKRLMSKAEDVLINDYPIVPLYFFVSKHMVKPHISGFEENVLDRHPSKYLSIKPQ